MAKVRLVGLGKQHQRGNEVIRALDGVSLDIEKGEFVAMVGRPGSGKTTMLDLTGILVWPTSVSLRMPELATLFSKIGREHGTLFELRG